MTFAGIVESAHFVGITEMMKCNPTPMVVESHVNPLDDSSPVVHQEVVEGGACGFAWINIKPGNSSFARYLKKEGIARTDTYYGGVTIWVGEGGQSMARKEAYARGYARVLQENGIRAYVGSRMD
jgi:hypothetical protein